MLKTANKIAKKQVLSSPALRQITTHNVYENSSTRFHARKDILDTYASVRYHVGFIRLNREHRHNLLTPNYIKNIRRSLETLNLDQVVKVIYMTGGNGEHFSNGTDFRTLLHYKKEGQDQKIAQYLEDLYGLQIQTSKLNKPLLSVAPGHSFNSGATFLQASGMPTVTLDSKLSFNEATFGFVPHGGSSFYLSRLPGEIGTFLAMTGFPITGVDAKSFGIADELVHYSSVFEEDICDILFAMEFPIPSGDLMSNKGRLNPWKDRINERKNAQQKQFMNEEYERARKKHEQILHEEFVEPKDKLPSLTADSDLFYKRQLDSYNQRFAQNEEFGYLEARGEGVYQNYYNWVMGYIQSHSGHPFSKDPRTLLLKNAQAINRIFIPSTYEEIIENLRKEDTPFSRQCLQKMEGNSTLSMKLALKMIRQARNLDFKGCIQNEINVALNKIQDEEFDKGVSQILLKPSNSGNSQGLFQKNVTEDQVNSYFQPNKWTESVQLDLVEKALLPTRFYYEKFSDQVRLWINEDSTPQPEVREHFDSELKEALREQGIDIRDRALTIKSAREHLYKQELVQRQQQAFEDRLTQMLTDDKLRNQYFERAGDLVEHLEKAPSQEFYRLVNSKIQNIFENAYLEKLNTIYNKSIEAQNLEKRRMFIKFKKFLFQSRILTYAHETTEKLFNRLNNMPVKEPHLKEKWDGSVTFREMEHPDLHKSFLSHISKAIGKSSIAPPELAKSFLTSGETAKALTVFTFDKKELERLRDDILANPLKYELALRSQKTSDLKIGYKPATKTKKHDEYDYWFRVLNGGFLPQDTLPYYKQLVAYKDFVDSIESKAFDTLRTTVQRLLLDFEGNYEGGAAGNNSVADFSQKDRESKHQAIRRLMGAINEMSEDQVTKDMPSTSQIVNNKQSPQQVHLTQSARSTKDIKRFINRLLEQDSEISQVIPKPDAQSSALTNKFREEVIGELYQLIEFVLVNNATKRAGSAMPPKHLLQERLASLTNPNNTQQRNVTNLRILDTYLNEQNSEALIKDAIKIAKPFFFNNVLSQRIEEEAGKIMLAFKAEASSNDVLHYYLMNIWYPETRHSAITKRVLEFNEDRDKERYFETLFPDQSRRYALKRYISMLGTSDKQINNKNDLEAAVRDQYAGLAELERRGDQIENNYQKTLEEQRKSHIAKPFDANGDDNLEIDNHPSMNIYNYDHNELDLIFQYSDKAENLKTYLDLNQQEITNSFSTGDWLHMFGMSIREHNLDMNMVMRMTDYNRKPEEEYQSEMQSIFSSSGVSKAQMTWDNLADYAVFLSQLFDQGVEASLAQDARENYDIMTDYIVKQMNIVDGEDLLRSQSVYEKIKHTKHTIGKIGVNKASLKDEVKSFAKLQQRILSERKARENVELLSKQAPKNVREIIDQVLSSQSQYVNISDLEKILLNKEYGKLKTSEGVSALIDREKLFADLRKNGGLKKFLDNYQNTRLDVVSLAEARETVANAPTSNLFDDRLQTQMRHVLEFVDEQLKLIPHSRREVMTLGEFLARHPYTSTESGNTRSQEQFLSKILKNKIEQVLGSSVDTNAADLIDWEYGSVRTNPMIHDQEDTRVKSSLAQGKGYSAELTSEAIIESQQNGRAAEALGDGAAIVSFVNPVTGFQEFQERPNYEYEQVLRDAHRLTQMRPEFTLTKNLYENEIMKLYTSPEFDQQQVEETIQRYTELRIRDCLLDEEFKNRIQVGNNGHLYLKMLKEQITEELKIGSEAKVSDFAFMKIFRDPNGVLPVDVEGRYNTLDVSNLQSVGLDKLINSQSETSTLDRLLGEYFLNKRGQYVATNKLLDQLNKHFGEKNLQFKDGHKAKSRDNKNINQDAYPFETDANLAYTHLLQTIEKESNPTIMSQDFNAVLELDIATQQALQNGKNGLSSELRIHVGETMEDLLIPEHFNLFDVRKPVNKYVEDKLGGLLEQIFSVRRKVEKTLTRNELLAYDRTLSTHLTKETLLPRLRTAVDEDRNTLITLKQSNEMLTEGKKNEELQSLKRHNEQPEFEQELKNEDALYKFLSYSGMLEKKRREDIDKTRKNNDLIYGIENFEEFYKGELQRDSKREPRTINPSDFTPRRVDNTKAGEGFLKTSEREEEYFREFEIYKENKREQQERNQLFFVLEQFFSHAKENPDPLNKAQEAIADYFKDTENTFFFDKNKIQ